MNVEFWLIPELVDDNLKYRFDCHFCGKPCKVYEIEDGSLFRKYSCECQQDAKQKERGQPQPTPFFELKA